VAEFTFLHKRKDILPYVETLSQEADKEKKALGFLSATAYESAAHSEKIIIAVSGEEKNYAGHVFYGGVFPNARIFQTLVKKEYRNEGLASSLIEQLVAYLESQSFSSLSAKVATDLSVANKVYESLGFQIVKTIKGGATTGRMLHLRCRELNSPSLFRWNSTPAVLTHLNLPVRSIVNPPQYMIDLNVVFDSVKKRAKAKAANTVLKAGFQNIIRIAISEELINELERTSYDKKDDPVLEMVKNFWTLTISSDQKKNAILKELAPIVFPERDRENKLTQQDKSDLIHLATAIDNNVAGFITSEKKILAASDVLRSKHQLEVISLFELKELIDDTPLPADRSERPFISCGLRTENFSPMDASAPVRKAERQLNISTSSIPSSTEISNEDLKAMIIFDDANKEVALAWWTVSIGPTPNNRAYLCIAEASEQFENLIDHICDHIIRDCSQRGPSLVSLTLGHTAHTIQNAVENNGFRPTGQTNPAGMVYQKICIGDALHGDNWQKLRLKISQLTNGLQLPHNMPIITPENKFIELSGEGRENFRVELSDFEALLSPTLLHSPNSPSVIVPIVKSYSDDLFGIKDTQFSLLDAPEAVLKRERVYFCTPSVSNLLQPGKLVFFYESGRQRGGRKSIIAVARITQTNVVKVEDMEENLLKRGVIDQNMLSKISQSGKRTVMFFNNILPFKTLIPFARLAELGCDDGSKFVTAKPITATQSKELLIQGLSNA